jgi:hypothetical protein
MVKIAALATALALLTPAAAHADAFVPADPPLTGSCGAAAGDLVLAGHVVGRERRIDVSVSVAGGAPQPLTRLHGCPVAAAAADGTAIVAGDGRDFVQLVVRLPGGELTRQATADPDVALPAVAAAPGGWTAAVWTELRDEGGERLVAAVFAPDGSARETVLARVPLVDDFVAPAIGIDGHGAATVAWGVTPRHGAPRIRTASTAGGAAWTAARDLAALGRHDAFPENRPVSVAVSPTGHVLLAWATRGGLTTQIDGGAPVRVDGAPELDSLSAAIADDGSALVAYKTGSDYLDRPAIDAVDRLPGAPWSQPAVLSNPRVPAFAGFSSEPEGPLSAVLAADGRAVVAWPAPTLIGSAVLAASGQVGGRWNGPVELSSVTRSAVIGSLRLDANGSPRLLWSESIFSDAQLPGDRLRGAVLSAAPAGPSASPRVVAHLPARVPLSRRNVYRLRLAVACPDGCDVRARLRGPYEEYAEAVADLPPGGSRNLRLVTHYELLPPRRPRHVRLDVIATNRAGGVTTRSRRLTVVSPRRAGSARPTARPAPPASRG